MSSNLAELTHFLKTTIFWRPPAFWENASSVTKMEQNIRKSWRQEIWRLTSSIDSAGLCVLIKGQCDQKKSPYVYKSCPKIISLEKWLIWSLYKNCLRMWEIWGNWLLPKALKSWTKSDKFAKSGHTVKGPPTKIKTIELVKPCLALPPSARSCPSKFGCGSHPGLQ